MDGSETGETTIFLHSHGMDWATLYSDPYKLYEHGDRNDAPTTDLNCLPWSHTRWECVDPDFDITI